MRTILNDNKVCAESNKKIEQLCTLISRKNYCFILDKQMQKYLSGSSGAPLVNISTFQDSWNDLSRDRYMAPTMAITAYVDMLPLAHCHQAILPT